MRANPFVLLVLGFTASAATAATKDPNWACRSDADKYCADVAPGGGRVKACLMKKKSELTEDCAAFYGIKAVKKTAKAEPAPEPAPVSEPETASEESALPSKPAAAGTTEFNCFMDNDVRQKLLDWIDRDSRTSSDEKTVTRKEVPQSISLSFPTQVLFKNNEAVVESKLSLTTDAKGTDSFRSKTRYVYSNKSLETEVEVAGKLSVFVVHDVTPMTVTTHQTERRNATFEHRGRPLLYVCSALKK